MQIHCDGCGRTIDSATAIQRKVDEEQFWFCSEACARSGRHLAESPYAEEEGAGTGPIAEGDVDEPEPPVPPRGKSKP